MKTVDISSNILSIKELLDMAKEESLLVKTKDGESFVISSADEFDSEVELLHRRQKAPLVPSSAFDHQLRWALATVC